jgi:hypothetical protein
MLFACIMKQRQTLTEAIAMLRKNTKTLSDIVSIMAFI